ncbi:hypothetical protein D3C72_2388480 [compost metagenome]
MFGACLGVVQRQQQTGWARVWSGQNTMFEDMDLSVTLPLVVQVITANLGNFIQGLLSAQPASETAQG